MSKLQYVCLGLLLTLPAFACAQQTPSQAALAGAAQKARPAFEPPRGLISLDVVVTDKLGKPVSGLEAGDFTLLDNGQAQKMVSFQAFDGITAWPNPPAELILVIDAINLSSQQASFAELEAGKFLRRNAEHLTQPVSIYLVSAGALLATSAPSTDGNALAAQIANKKNLRVIWQNKVNANLGDFLALQATSYQGQSALTALGAIVLEERRKPGRKLLVWIGPGWPAAVNSFDWITEFSTRMREARIALYSVTSWPYRVGEFPYQNYLQGIQSAQQVSSDYLAQTLTMEVLTTQSGGRVLEPDKDLAGLIEKCAHDAPAFYTLSFDPPRTGIVDEFHNLEVQVGKPELTARTRTGYYDQPSYYDQPNPEVQRVTVSQLEQLLEKAQGRSDAEGARQLSALELTERLSDTKLSSWKTRLTGAKTRIALVALADASVFLAPPAEEIPATPPPELAEQQLMLSRTIHYLANTIPKLPNFFATRTTARYEEPPLTDGQTWKLAMGDRLLHFVGSSSATLLYRDGAEVVDAQTAKGKKQKKEESVLTTRGTFGPILSVVIQDAAHGQLEWSRWEQGAGGPRAVFRFVVPWEQSDYEVTYCCFAEGDGTETFHRLTSYHGEMAIDPDSGAILRLVVQADLEPNQPLLRSNILVEYAPVPIGGNPYICPTRSVSLSRGRSLIQIHEWGQAFRVYGPFQTMLNDVAFGDYHMFRSEARILPEYEPAPEEQNATPGSTAAPKPKP
jgi:VWFA-related protein